MPGRWVSDISDALPPDAISAGQDAETTITARIAQLDEIISRQFDEIMHCPEFLRVEARWRGLHYLVFHTEESPLCQIRVLNVSKAEMIRDLNDQKLFDSMLYEKVYREAAGSFGAHPYTLLVGDYDFGPSDEDIALLSRLSRLAAAAAAPFIAGAAPAMFGLRSFSEQRWERGREVDLRA